MKRFGMMMVACLLADNLFAVGNQPTTEKEKFNVNINVTKLSNYLKLNGKQQEEVAKGKVYEDNPILAVIQPASVPMQSSNSKKKILLVYTFLGFMAASAWVLRKELLSLIPLSGRQ